jgi:hypothetical protein
MSLCASWEKVRGIGATAMRGCGCGMPTPHVSAADFELDLLEFLTDCYKHEPSLHRILKGAAHSPTTLSAVLSALAVAEIDPGLRHKFADDIQRSIASFSDCSANQGNFYCAAP